MINKRFKVRQLFKGDNYSREATIRGNTVFIYLTYYICWCSETTYLQKSYLFRPNMKNKEIHLRYLEEYMSYSSAMYGASMYLYDGKCSFKSCFELASKASFCTSCCCCSKCSSQGKIRQKKFVKKLFQQIYQKDRQKQIAKNFVKRNLLKRLRKTSSKKFVKILSKKNHPKKS